MIRSIEEFDEQLQAYVKARDAWIEDGMSGSVNQHKLVVAVDEAYFKLIENIGATINQFNELEDMQQFFYTEQDAQRRIKEDRRGYGV